MRVFLDFEASSLSRDSYPIEVGWVFEDGHSAEFLIRPAPGWTDWEEGAARIHGISRDTLDRDGAAHESVARAMVDALTGHALYASAPSWDGKWLSLLLRSAGFDRRTLQLQKSDALLLESAAERLQSVVAPEALSEAVDAVVRAAQDASERPLHRALSDAEQERRIWLEVCRLADEAAARRRASGPGD